MKMVIKNMKLKLNMKNEIENNEIIILSKLIENEKITINFDYGYC